MWLTHLLSYLLFAIKQYIDATKRGGIGRFLNHSCAPNCYVAKWTVGSHYRMGIFASRNVQKMKSSLSITMSTATGTSLGLLTAAFPQSDL